MARYRGWLGAAVAAVLLAGMAVLSIPSTQPPPAPTSSTADPSPAARPQLPDQATGGGVALAAARNAAVSALLEQRADAVRRHDQTAFLASVDPHADPAFRQAQQGLFDNLGAVGFSEWSYQLNPDDTVSPPDPAGLPGAPDEVWAPQVRLRYAVTGGDEVPTTRPMGYLFARHASTWYLVADDQLEDRGRPSWRGPWDYGPCQVTRTASGVVLSHPGAEAVATRVATELDPAVEAVTEVWGGRWSKRVTVLVPTSTQEMRSQVGSQFATDGIAAVAIADRVDTRTHRVEGARVVLNPTTAQTLSDTALRVVLRHEITHVAARAVTVDGSPMWLLEGFADYVGYRGSGIEPRQAAPNLAELVDRSGPPTDLPDNADFQRSAGGLDLAYQTSWSVSLYVAHRSGEAKLVALYRRIASQGKATDDTLDAAFRSVLGVSRTEFLRGWRDYLARTF